MVGRRRPRSPAPILARGGEQGGNGGFVEVSGKQTLAYTGLADLRATNGSFGALLLDPLNFTVGGTPGPNNMSVGDLTTALNNGDVFITNNSGTGPGDITVMASFGINPGQVWTEPTKLTISAFRDIIINDGVTISNQHGGKMDLRADNTGSGSGTIVFQQFTSGSRVDWTASTGTLAFYYNSTSFPNQTTDFTPAGQGGGTRGVTTNSAVQNQFVPYVLVNNLTQLQNMTLSGNFALGNSNINGGAFTGFTGTFTGNFDGQDNTISNLTVTGPSMFGSNAGTIKNLTIDGINIAASANNQKIGVLVGENQTSGKIIDVMVNNSSVDGLSFTGISAGLMAGQNLGLISNGYVQGSVTIGDGSMNTGWNYAGGLAGINVGTINEQSNADVTVLAGTNAFVGGLVGLNGNLMSAPAVIENSSAEGTVTATGYNVAVGGLVGFNAPGAKIYDSNAVGNVTASGSVPPANTGPDCMPDCRQVLAGGLVGENQGEIASIQSPYMTFAQGNVSVGSNAIGGGFVGVNNGIITDAAATGDVTGLAGTPLSANDFDTYTALGGFAGFNRGLTSGSIAGGSVGTLGVERLEIGGFVAHNSGTINTSQFAGGAVSAGNFSQAGGFAGSGEDNCGNCAPPNADGTSFYNTNTISNSAVATAVTVGDNSLAGGFIGSGSTILNSHAIGGSVIGGMNSVLGGFVGAHNIGGQIYASTVNDVTVNANGPYTWAGGFVGYNGGDINASHVIGGLLTANSYSTVGGFAAVNIGLIDQNSSTYNHFINALNNNVVGAFTGANFGKLDTINVTMADVTINSNNVFGTVVGANAHFTHFNNNFVPPTIQGSTFPTGTFANVQTSGNLHETGTGNTPGFPFVGQQFPSQLPSYPSILANCNDAMCGIFNNGVLGAPPGYGNDHPQIPNVVQAPPNLPPNHAPPQPPGNLIQLANFNPTPPTPPGGGPGLRPPVGPQNTPGLNPASLAPVLPQRPTCGVGGSCTSFASLLPPGQFIPNQVVVQIPQNISQQNVQQILAQMGSRCSARSR